VLANAPKGRERSSPERARRSVTETAPSCRTLPSYRSHPPTQGALLPPCLPGLGLRHPGPQCSCEESSTPLLHWGLLPGKGSDPGGRFRWVTWAEGAARSGGSLADGGAKAEGTSPVSIWPAKNSLCRSRTRHFASCHGSFLLRLLLGIFHIQVQKTATTAFSQYQHLTLLLMSNSNLLCRSLWHSNQIVCLHTAVQAAPLSNTENSHPLTQDT